MSRRLSEGSGERSEEDVIDQSEDGNHSEILRDGEYEVVSEILTILAGVTNNNTVNQVIERIEANCRHENSETTPDVGIEEMRNEVWAPTPGDKYFQSALKECGKIRVIVGNIVITVSYEGAKTKRADSSADDDADNHDNDDRPPAPCVAVGGNGSGSDDSDDDKHKFEKKTDAKTGGTVENPRPIADHTRLSKDCEYDAENEILTIEVADGKRVRYYTKHCGVDQLIAWIDADCKYKNLNVNARVKMVNLAGIAMSRSMSFKTAMMECGLISIVVGNIKNIIYQNAVENAVKTHPGMNPFPPRPDPTQL